MNQDRSSRELRRLLARTLSGDTEAFGEVVSRFQDMAYGYAHGLLGDADEARDAVQEAFLAAYRKLGDLRDLERFPGWFRRILLSACREVARRRPRPAAPLDAADEVVAPGGGPPGAAERRELQAAVLAALARLPQPHRVTAVLHYLNGYSLAEIGAFLDVPLGTVKRRLHEARRQLRERMIGTMLEHRPVSHPSPELRRHILERIGHWERFWATDEIPGMVSADPEWVRLVEAEIALEPLSVECRAIRRQIASLEPCHEHYLANVESIVGMVRAMQPGQVLDCGQACAARHEEAAAYAGALERWRDQEGPADDEPAAEVFGLLGECTATKGAPVEHLIAKVRDNGYRVYADEDQSLAQIEARIQHLEICNYNWRENLQIVLREIAAGTRLAEWHVPDGYNAHGDCPDRCADLQPLVGPAAAWAAAPGEATPEQRWLVASLCKHAKDQHLQHRAARGLPLLTL